MDVGRYLRSNNNERAVVERFSRCRTWEIDCNNENPREVCLTPQINQRF